jgi:hypothetical protein
VTGRRARALLDRFGAFMDGFSGCFSRAPQRAAASQYLEGLFGDSERKSMQAMHGRLSDPAMPFSVRFAHAFHDGDQILEPNRLEVHRRRQLP